LLFTGKGPLPFEHLISHLVEEVKAERMEEKAPRRVRVSRVRG